MRRRDGSRREPARIEIDRLVVESSAADARELERSLRAELAHLHASGPAQRTARSGRLELPDRALETTAGASARDVGRQVARTIWAAANDARRGETR